MAKPNYSFEKRQRELSKKKKKEEKAKEKEVRKVSGDAGGGDDTQGSAPDAGQAPAEVKPAP